MTVTSATWDRFAIGASVIFAIGCVGAVLPAFVDVADFPIPPAIALVAFLPLFLVWVTAIRPVVTVGAAGIRGLTWGNNLVPWSDIESAEITGDLLQVIPTNARTYIRSPHLIRFRPGTRSNALVAKLDPAATAAVAHVLSEHRRPQID